MTDSVELTRAAAEILRLFNSGHNNLGHWKWTCERCVGVGPSIPEIEHELDCECAPDKIAALQALGEEVKRLRSEGRRLARLLKREYDEHEIMEDFTPESVIRAKAPTIAALEWGAP